MTRQSGARIFVIQSSGFLRPSSFSINPLVALRNEDGQLLHHVLSLSDRANHVHTRSGVPFLRHFLTGMTAPALCVGVASKNAPIDFSKLAIMQPRLTSAVDVVAVIEHETRPV